MRFILIFSLIFLFFAGCTKIEKTIVNSNDIKDVYRFHYGSYKGFDVWIVDGAKVREKIFNEFIFGGNDERYPFVPLNETWIDNSINCTEFMTTLEHEILERNLMKNNLMTYYDAHDSALLLEYKMRNDFLDASKLHESRTGLVMPVDYDTTQEIESLPEKIKLNNVYKVYLGKRDDLDIWIVDGYGIRRDIYPDFGFSGNDIAYKFIPEKEIWIDSEISCEEMEYSITLELRERKNMIDGKSYDDAYINAIAVTDSLRKSQSELIKTKLLKKPEKIFRDTGVANP